MKIQLRVVTEVHFRQKMMQCMGEAGVWVASAFFRFHRSLSCGKIVPLTETQAAQQWLWLKQPLWPWLELAWLDPPLLAGRLHSWQPLNGKNVNFNILLLQDTMTTCNMLTSYNWPILNTRKWSNFPSFPWNSFIFLTWMAVFLLSLYNLLQYLKYFIIGLTTKLV